jgi:hypothetical protein
VYSVGEVHAVEPFLNNPYVSKEYNYLVKTEIDKEETPGGR